HPRRARQDRLGPRPGRRARGAGMRPRRVAPAAPAADVTPRDAAPAADAGNLAAALTSRVAALDSVVVAFSCGVDSSVVAALAYPAPGARALAAPAVAPHAARGALDGAKPAAAHTGIRHETIATDELAREGYRANGRARRSRSSRGGCRCARRRA